ncbi:MAG: hypothetical protein HC927_01430, partial [Deltaproteobacteria bacterium]|nr:hypothetical protein [Deltaproteobacteria bacterium]
MPLIDRRALSSWLRQFRERGDRQALSGRPLRSLGCSDEEYAELRSLLRGVVPYSRAEHMLLTLFIVEWLRREFSGGAWTYEPIIRALELPRDLVLDPGRLDDALEQGWGIEVLRTRSGRDFLATLLLHAMPSYLLAELRTTLSDDLRAARAQGATLDQLVPLAR